jgi:hypothetical protein
MRMIPLAALLIAAPGVALPSVQIERTGTLDAARPATFAFVTGSPGTEGRRMLEQRAAARLTAAGFAAVAPDKAGYWVEVASTARPGADPTVTLRLISPADGAELYRATARAGGRFDMVAPYMVDALAQLPR